MRLSPGRRAVRTALVLPAVVALTVTGAGCSTTVPGTAVIAEPKVGQPVTWGPCRTAGGGGGNALPIPAGAQCGQIGVPVDYAKPDGDVATLALIRFPATGEKIGSLILNPGGPGSPASRPPPASSGTCPPRSASGSTWSASTRAGGCLHPGGVVQPDADNDRIRADPQVDYSPAGVEHIEGQTKAFIQRCIDKMGKDFPEERRHQQRSQGPGRAAVAAVGDEKLTHLGYSYGTRIGAAYAEAYPDKVRGMILDGAVDPNADPIKADLAQAAAFQQAFNDYAADCAEDPTCPAGHRPGQGRRGLPRPGRPAGGPADANGRPARPRLQRRHRRHHHGVVLAQPVAAPDPGAHRDDRGPRRHHAGAGRHVHAPRPAGALHQRHRRPDRGQLRGPAAVADRDKVIEKTARCVRSPPFMSYGEFTGHAPLSTCAFWPVPPTSTPHSVSAPGLPPVLVVSTTNDPATPTRRGGSGQTTRRRAADLQRHPAHVVFQGNNCVDQYAGAYLVDLTLPPPGASC